jgi:hypothetical protein
MCLMAKYIVELSPTFTVYVFCTKPSLSNIGCYYKLWGSK